VDRFLGRITSDRPGITRAGSSPVAPAGTAELYQAGRPCRSPLHVRLAGDPRMTLEQFWHEAKCLAVWEED
jgi:hypothetical protein